MLSTQNRILSIPAYVEALSKIAVDAMSTFAGLKKEIETIVRLRVEKAINKLNLVKRDEFDTLKKTVQKLANDRKNNKFETKKTKKAKLNLQKKKKFLKK